ncbi:MAG: hypothetical protein WB611_02940 [Stellaceae bacterium]
MSDFLIADHGSVIAIVPLTRAAVQWIDENIVSEPSQWLGGALCVDPHYARDLTDMITAAGLSL